MSLITHRVCQFKNRRFERCIKEKVQYCVHVLFTYNVHLVNDAAVHLIINNIYHICTSTWLFILSIYCCLFFQQQHVLVLELMNGHSPFRISITIEEMEFDCLRIMLILSILVGRVTSVLGACTFLNPKLLQNGIFSGLNAPQLDDLIEISVNERIISIYILK